MLPTLIEVKEAAAAAADPKFDPSTVMILPPLVGFETGRRTLNTVGELYANIDVEFPVKPSTVTTIAAEAPVPLGAVHVKEVWSTITLTDSQVPLPTLTKTSSLVAAVPKFTPVRVIRNPPDVGLLPENGRNAVTRGLS